MNTIKGLILKDLLQLRNYKKTLFVFIIIFVLTSITQEGMDSMLVVMLTLGFGMFSIATFSYDELAKADRYILTMPLTKKEVVLSKYILVICSTIIGAIIGTIISLVINIGMNKEIPEVMESIAISLGAIFGLGLVQSIQIPCIYKWGAEKGRIQLFIVGMMMLLVGFGIIFIGEKVNIEFTINDFFNKIIYFIPVILLILTIIIYFISYKVSYKIYSKKEM